MSSACLFTSAVLLGKHSHFNPLVGVSCQVTAAWLYLSGTFTWFQAHTGLGVYPHGRPLVSPVRVSWGLGRSIGEHLRGPMTQMQEL